LNESFQALRQRMAASAQHIQNQEKEHQSNIAHLTEEYESRLTELERTSQEKSHKIEALEYETMRMGAVEESKVQLENQLILLERKASDSKSEFEEQIHQIQVKMKTFREEAKQRTFENQKLIEEREDLVEKLKSSEFRTTDLENQIESLQVVWAKNNSLLEQEKEKNASLQKLNQQVSLSLNEARQDIKRLKENLDTSRLKNSDLIRSLESQIRTLIKQQSAEESDAPNSIDKDSLIRIESLIAEVQSGMTDC
jgi:chromosome segregation ATPase